MIYFIQDSFSKAVKIGHGKDVAKRMAGMQTGCPGVLTLLGTVEGGPREEALLHDQFEAFHLRGEWFRGEDELLTMIRLMLFRNGKASTVWDECRKRGGCRSGLKGVVVGVRGWIEPYMVWGSRWTATRTLNLAVCLSEEFPPRWFDRRPGGNRLLTYSAQDLVDGVCGHEYPDSFIRDMEADRCMLLSEWPIVCCSPDQQVEDFDV